MTEWKPTRLGDNISLKGGLSYKGEFVDKGEAVLVGMGCVSHTERFLVKGGRRYGGEFSESHRVRPGDLVIATRQQSDNLPILGFPAMIPDELKGRDVVAATNLYKVFNDSDIDNRFLYWLLRGSAYRERILGCAKGTTVRMLTKDAIEDFQFLCPPAHERDAITNILDSLDDRIELNRRINETLEAMARALFKDWFVDFGPTRAKQEGLAPYLAPELWSLFPERLDAEGKPDGWSRRAIGSLGRVVTGKTPTTKDQDNFDGPYPFITIPDLGDRVFIDSSARTLSEKGVYAVKSSLLPANAVMMSCIATVGKCGITTRKSVTNQKINSVICHGDIEPLFLYWSFRGLGSRLHEAGGGGSVYTNVSKSRFSDLHIVVPLHELQQSFAGPWFARIKANEENSRTLAQTRDLLLPKLMSGEIRIQDAERTAEAVL